MASGPQGIIDRIEDLLDDYGPQIPAALPEQTTGKINIVTGDLQVAEATLKTPAAPITDVPAPTAKNSSSPSLDGFEVTRASYNAIRSLLAVPAPVAVDGVTYGTPLDVPTPVDTAIPAPPSTVPNIPFDDAYEAVTLDEQFDLPPIGARPQNVDIGGDPYAPVDPTLPSDEVPEEPDLAEYAPPAADWGSAPAVPGIEGQTFTEQMQKQMLDAAINEMKRDEFAAINQVIMEGAGRNFFGPTPMMNAGILEVTDKARRQRIEANVAILKEAFGADLQTNQMLVNAGVDINRQYVKWYVSQVGDMVKLQRFNLQMLEALSKSAMELYNAKVALVKEYYGAARAYLSAVDAQNDASAAGAQIEDAKLNQVSAEVNAFSAQINTWTTAAGVLDTQAQVKSLPFERLQNDLPLVDANIQVTRDNLQGLSAAIDAYRRYYEADVQRFDAVAEGNRALSSVTGVDQANRALYAKELNTETGRGEAYLAFKQGQVTELEAALAQFRDYVGAHRSEIATLQQQVAAEASKVQDYVRTLAAKASYLGEWNRASASRVAAINALASAASETSSRSQALDAQAKAAEARIEAGRLSAEAQTAASFATAALGITSGTARMTGTVGVSDATEDSGQQSIVETGIRSYTSQHIVKKA